MPDKSTSYKNEPVYWFVILAKALEVGRLTEAAQAQCELERLGYTVRYRRTKYAAKQSEREAFNAS